MFVEIAVVSCSGRLRTTLHQLHTNSINLLLCRRDLYEIIHAFSPFRSSSAPLCHLSTVVPSDLRPGPQSYILRLPWFLPVTSHVSKFYLANPIYTLPCPVQFSSYLSMCSASEQSSDLTPLVVYKLLYTPPLFFSTNIDLVPTPSVPSKSPLSRS